MVLGKIEPGEERPIGLLPLFVRVWERVRRPGLTNWCLQRVGHWDAAVAKSSALRATILSKALGETAAATATPTMTLYLDLAKFYDTVSPCVSGSFVAAIVSRKWAGESFGKSTTVRAPGKDAQCQPFGDGASVCGRRHVTTRGADTRTEPRHSDSRREACTENPTLGVCSRCGES